MSNVEGMIADALATARTGAAEAGFTVGQREGANRVIAPKPRERVGSDELGVSLTTDGRSVVIYYPSEYARFVYLPVAWLRERTEATDELIAKHCDVAWLVGMVLDNNS